MKDKTYEKLGTSSTDNWMEQERRYEAKHSPWDLDDNAAYLDEEHRQHCEAREARRAHEKECEVKRPETENLQDLMARQFKQVRKVSGSANAAVKPFAIAFTIIAIIMFMMIISIFVEIIARF